MIDRIVVVTYSDIHLPTEKLKQMFPERAVKDAFGKLLEKTDLSGVVIVCVHKSWWSLSSRRYVTLYQGKKVQAYFRANGTPLVCDISSDQVSSKALYLKLRVAGDKLNEEWRANWEANSPAREIKKCREQISRLARRRQAHKKRIAKEQRFITGLEHQIAERRQRIKDLKTA